jgi:hypothetical protein
MIAPAVLCRLSTLSGAPSASWSMADQDGAPIAVPVTLPATAAPTDLHVLTLSTRAPYFYPIEDHDDRRLYI